MGFRRNSKLAVNTISMKKEIVLGWALLIAFQLGAQPYAGKEKVQKFTPSKAAACSPPTTTTTMSINNVRMVVHTAGNLWQDFPQNKSIYEVPKNSGIMAIFTAALWLGGTDANGQLKLAALRYREGQDYWTGPLTNVTAETNSDVCSKYDKHFISTQDEVRTFVSWFQAGEEDAANGTNTQSTLFPDYKVPDIIKNWPAHGDVSLGQDLYLAPFFDVDNDGFYNWEKGDYPWHDIYKTKDCQVDRRVSLYGDLNYWWVMNDKGNIHTETGADAIGMEIRAQAFAFATGDEINNMTFYNYELINRGSLTLFNTYFGFFTDGALGNPNDDYVGCDVNRGLAYYYNGNNYDADNGGFKGYGFSPPAVGIDFFEGPYQDNDGVDNAYGIGENEALNGLGYGDGIVDNERFGMRRFLYYSNTTNGANINQTDPIGASDYYNYLRGFWKDNTPFYYGGSGHISDPEANPNVPCDFMFPGDTDPLGWGTNGFVQNPWTEQTAGNTPNDRRFVQSAGPFVLKPGAVNNITVGAVYARSNEGDPFASVEVLRRADDKAQALFENCFRIIEAPHAPDVDFQELENEVIIFLSNKSNSNNFNEGYEEIDPFIVSSDPNADRKYRFQGYQIFQIVNPSIAISELDNPAESRLVAQCDIKDDVSRIVNFEYDNQIQAIVPEEKVVGENKGIRHSFRITEDAFASGDRKLVNFKRYYFIAVSYAYNSYKEYIPGDPLNLDGQKIPYLRSRKAAVGEIKYIEVIPHSPIPEAGGTAQLASYGETPNITRIDGHGNGNRILELTPASENTILKNGYMEKPTYQKGFGPLDVKVIDPLNLADGYFECVFHSYTPPNTPSGGNSADSSQWLINRYDKENGQLLETVYSTNTIAVENEQLIPQWGISVQIVQKRYFREEGISGGLNAETTDILESTITFADSSKRWLTPISDFDGYTALNWIRSGTTNEDNFEPGLLYESPACYRDEIGKDPDRRWNKIIEGGFAPHALVGYQCDFMPLAYSKPTLIYPGGTESSPGSARNNAVLSFSPSIDIVITKDPSKWTKCVVLELGRDPSLNVGGAKPGERRKSPSLGQNLSPIAGTGTSWFPGYAIDVETGARLHMAFGENSFLGTDGGSDMQWNPGSRMFDQVGNPKLGGMQPIYVFSHKQKTINGFDSYDMGTYNGETNNISELTDLMDMVEANDVTAKRNFYSSLSWVGYMRLTPNHESLETDVRIRIRLNKEYKHFVATNKNAGAPMYSWSMNDMFTRKNLDNKLAEALDIINVVPNPYYAYSEYERNRLDNRVKITNLPENCTIQIFTTNGKLVKTFRKSSVLTYQDWELKNEKEVPVASGIYLIYVNVPGIGEKVLKLFLGQRQIDLQGL